MTYISPASQAPAWDATAREALPRDVERRTRGRASPAVRSQAGAWDRESLRCDRHRPARLWVDGDVDDLGLGHLVDLGAAFGFDQHLHRDRRSTDAFDAGLEAHNVA